MILNDKSSTGEIESLEAQTMMHLSKGKQVNLLHGSQSQNRVQLPQIKSLNAHAPGIQSTREMKKSPWMSSARVGMTSSKHLYS